MNKLRIFAAIAFGLLCFRACAVHVIYSQGRTWYFMYADNGNYSEVKLTATCAEPAIEPSPTGTSFTVPEKLGTYYKVAQIGPYAFAECSNLKQITVPSTLWGMCERAFWKCTAMTEMTVPASITSMDGAVFYGCGSPFSLRFSSWDHWQRVSCASGKYWSGLLSAPSGITLYVAGKAVTRLEDLPASVRKIPNGAFLDYEQFTFTDIPSQVTNVGLRAFAYCHSITNLVLSRGDLHFGTEPFAWSTLKDIRFAGEVLDLSDGICCRCAQLTNVTFASAVTNIGASAFEYCAALGQIDLPQSVEAIGDSAFGYCTNLVAIALPPKVRRVPEMAFFKDTALESVSLPQGLESIGSSAFQYCEKLAEIEIPNTVTSIEYRAFSECSRIKSVTLPPSVAAIDRSAFGCGQLQTVRATGPKPSASSCFAGTPTNLVTIVENYDPSWDPALEAGVWCNRKIVCSNDWTVTFDLGGKGERTGGGALVQTVYTGGAATAPTVVSTNEDYVFVGWDKTFDDIPFRRTINAVYDPKPMAAKGSTELSVCRFDDGVSIQLAAYGGVKPYVWTALSGFPEGMAISTNGVISGNTAFLGTTTLEVRITDARGVAETLSYTLTVEENPDAKPALDARLPADDRVVIAHGRERTFSVSAHDPEDGQLRYRWFVDGDEQTEATNSVFAYRDPDGGITNREIRCVIEDAVWKLGYTTETAWSVQTLFAPEIVSVEGEFFVSGSGEVSVTCNVPEAELFLAVGFAPRFLEKFRYTAPVTLDRSATVWAVARCGDQITSYVSRRFTVATPALSEPVGAGADVQFTTGGDAEWSPDGASLRSGAVGPEGASWLEAVFTGAGTFRFRWKTDCEHDPDGICSWDALEVFVDGSLERFAAIDGTGDWEEVSIDFAGSGNHTLRWRFSRDDYDEPDAAFANCGWISDVSWCDAVLPELGDDATAAKVSEALASAADSRLRAHVTTAARYARFRDWALGLETSLGITPAAVLAHARSWHSFAFAQNGLLAAELSDSDIRILSFSQAGSTGIFSLTASVGDLTIPSTANTDDLKEALFISGTSELGGAAFDPANLEVEVHPPVDGKLSISVRPTCSSENCYVTLGLRP